MANYIDSFINLLEKQYELESQITSFVNKNINTIIKDIIADGTHEVQENLGEFIISLGGDHTVIMDGETYTAFALVYNPDKDIVYVLTTETDEYLIFTDIEPMNQFDIINILIDPTR